MSVNLTINGATYAYPEQGDVEWGPDATSWASAVTVGMLQKAGGLFQLLAEVDFGSTYGIKSLYLKSRTANTASTGQIRLARADSVSFRNEENTADLALSVSALNVLTFNGVPIGGSTTVTSVSNTASINLTITNTDLTADLNLSAELPDAGFTGISLSIETDGLQAQVANSDIQGLFSANDTDTIDMSYSAGTYSADIKSDSITDAMIKTSAAIAFSKLAALTAGYLIVGSVANVPTAVEVTGDVTISNAGVTAIGTNKVTNSQLAQMPTLTLKGNATGGTANASDLTGSQATALLSAFVGDSGAGGTKGLVPAPGVGDSVKFLKGDGTWAPGGGGAISTAPGSAITTDYAVVSDDNGRTLNVDTSSTVINITLPSPVAGFKVTVKDFKGNASVNPITIVRSGSEKIDDIATNDIISSNYSSVSFVTDGTDWYRVAGYQGSTPTASVRGLFAGGEVVSATNTINYITIPTLSNALDFGDLTVARQSIGACASATRAVFDGGQTASPVNTIDYVTIATTGNATDFGDLTVARSYATGCSNTTRGLFGGGYTTGAVNTIDYITIATTGNATDFGDLSGAGYATGACSSSTRAIWGGGLAGPTNTIDYVTIATTGNATNFGTLTVARSSLAGCSSSTRGLFGGGVTSNVIDYVTIATTGNASDFGDLTVARYALGAASSTLRGVWAGGNSGSYSNVIDYVTIATTGNASDFGDLTASVAFLAGCSNAHGGL